MFDPKASGVRFTTNSHDEPDIAVNPLLISGSAGVGGRGGNSMQNLFSRIGLAIRICPSEIGVESRGETLLVGSGDRMNESEIGLLKQRIVRRHGGGNQIGCQSEQKDR